MKGSINKNMQAGINNGNKGANDIKAAGGASAGAVSGDVKAVKSENIKVVTAFAIVYLVWGSTYYFIKVSVGYIPPMMVGCLRYLVAGILMLLWCVLTKEKIFSRRILSPAIVSGLLLLVGGNGGLIWAEQYIPSSLAAILLASGPIWFVVLDKGKGKENFSSKATIIGLVVGFSGVILLFWEKLRDGFGGAAGSAQQLNNSATSAAGQAA